MRQTHLIIGLLGVIAFVLTGQILAHHDPNIHTLSSEVRMMYISRHIYLLGSALVNLTLGLYLQVQPAGWRRRLQQGGSLLIILSPISLLLAFVAEPARGMAGRSWLSFFGLIALFAGVMMHFVSSLTRSLRANV